MGDITCGKLCEPNTHSGENGREVEWPTGDVEDDIAYLVVPAQHSKSICVSVSSCAESYTYVEVKEERSSCMRVSVVSWPRRFAKALSLRLMRLSCVDNERL